MREPRQPQRRDEALRTALVCMPWLLVDSPSIQLGMLQAVLARAGLGATAHSFHLAYLEFATATAGPAGPLTVADYLSLAIPVATSGGVPRRGRWRRQRAKRGRCPR